MAETYPQYYTYERKPVAFVKAPDGGLFVWALSPRTGEFELDKSYLDKIWFGTTADIDTLTRDEFVQAVEEYRGRRLSGDGPAYAFARAIGAVEQHREHHLLADLSVPASSVDPAYEVVQWRGRCPDEHRASYLAMRNQMNADVPSGELDVPKAEPKLVVWALAGAEVVSMNLGGATDVRARGMEVGLDAALIQKWLTQRTNKKGKPYLGGVDGEFGDGSKAAFDAFFADTYKKRDKPPYAEILELLARDECLEAAQ